VIGKFLASKFQLATNTSIHLLNLLKKHIEKAKEEIETLPQEAQSLARLTISELENEISDLPQKIINFLLRVEEAGKFFDQLMKELNKQS